MTVRNYEHFDRYLNELIADIYEQPVDAGHTAMTLDIINKWIPNLVGCQTVADMGCGQISPQSEFEKYGIEYVGFAIGNDVVVSQKQGKNVHNRDMTFTEMNDESADLIYSRHSLEHSPFPLLTLMEWHRIAKHWLLLVLPSPAHHLWTGRNHYAVMNWEQAEFFLRMSGWNIIWRDDSEPTEIRVMCEKVKRK